MDPAAATLLAFFTFLIGYALGHVRGRNAEPLPPPAPPDPDALARARPVLEREGKIAAIKAYRQATGVGLRDAKLAVDSLERPG